MSEETLKRVLVAIQSLTSEELSRVDQAIQERRHKLRALAPAATSEHIAAANARLRETMVSLPHPTGDDNAAIDADLAVSNEETHEPSSGLPPELHTLATRERELRREAEWAGIFLSDRPLLACPRCGLMEDVAWDGRLITYFGNPRADDTLVDTGLRFDSLVGGFRCPHCQAVLKAPDEDMEA